MGKVQLINQIIELRGLSGIAATKLRARLSSLDEAGLRAELSKVISAQEKDLDKGVVLERGNKIPAPENLGNYTTKTDEAGRMIMEERDGETLLSRRIKWSDENNNSYESVITYEDGKVVKRLELKNGNTVSSTEYEYLTDNAGTDGEFNHVLLKTKNSDRSEVLTDVLEVDADGNWLVEDLFSRKTTKMNGSTATLQVNNGMFYEEIVENTSNGKREAVTIYSGNDFEAYENGTLEPLANQVSINGQLYEAVEYKDGNTKTHAAHADNLTKLMKKFGMSKDELIELNGRIDKRLRVNQDLWVSGYYEADDPKILAQGDKNANRQEYYEEVEYPRIQAALERQWKAEQAAALEKQTKEYAAAMRELYKNVDSKYYPALQQAVPQNEKNHAFWVRFSELDKQTQGPVLNTIQQCKKKGINDTYSIAKEVMKYFPDVNLFASGKKVSMNSKTSPWLNYGGNNAPVSVEVFVKEQLGLDITKGVGQEVVFRLSQIPQDALSKLNGRDFSPFSKSATFDEVASVFSYSGINIRTADEIESNKRSAAARDKRYGISEQKFASEMLANIYDYAADMLQEYYRSQTVVDAGLYLEGLKNICGWLTGGLIENTPQTIKRLRSEASKFRNMPVNNASGAFQKEFKKMLGHNYDRKSIQALQEYMSKNGADLGSEKFKSLCRKAFGFSGLAATEKQINLNNMGNGIGDIAIMLVTLGATAKLKTVGKASQWLFKNSSKAGTKLLGQGSKATKVVTKGASLVTSSAMGATTLGGYTAVKESVKNILDPNRDATSWEKTWKPTLQGAAHSAGFGAFGGVLTETVITPVMKLIEKPASKYLLGMSQAAKGGKPVNAQELFKAGAAGPELPLSGLFKMSGPEIIALTRTALSKGVGFGLEVAGFTGYETVLQWCEQNVFHDGKMPDGMTERDFMTILEEQFVMLGEIKAIGAVLMMHKGSKMAQVALREKMINESEVLKNTSVREITKDGKTFYEVTLPNGNKAVATDMAEIHSFCEQSMQTEYMVKLIMEQAKKPSKVEKPTENDQINHVLVPDEGIPQAGKPEAKVEPKPEVKQDVVSEVEVKSEVESPTTEGKSEGPSVVETVPLSEKAQDLMKRLETASSRDEFSGITRELKNLPQAEKNVVAIEYNNRYNAWRNQQDLGIRAQLEPEAKPEAGVKPFIRTETNADGSRVQDEITIVETENGIKIDYVHKFWTAKQESTEIPARIERKQKDFPHSIDAQNISPEYIKTAQELASYFKNNLDIFTPDHVMEVLESMSSDASNSQMYIEFLEMIKPEIKNNPDASLNTMFLAVAPKDIVAKTEFYNVLKSGKYDNVVPPEKRIKVLSHIYVENSVNSLKFLETFAEKNINPKIAGAMLSFIDESTSIPVLEKLYDNVNEYVLKGYDLISASSVYKNVTEQNVDFKLEMFNKLKNSGIEADVILDFVKNVDENTVETARYMLEAVDEIRNDNISNCAIMLGNMHSNSKRTEVWTDAIIRENFDILVVNTSACVAPHNFAKYKQEFLEKRKSLYDNIIANLFLMPASAKQGINRTEYDGKLRNEILSKFSDENIELLSKMLKHAVSYGFDFATPLLSFDTLVNFNKRGIKKLLETNGLETNSVDVYELIVDLSKCSEAEFSVKVERIKNGREVFSSRCDYVDLINIPEAEWNRLFRSTGEVEPPIVPDGYKQQVVEQVNKPLEVDMESGQKLIDAEIVKNRLIQAGANSNVDYHPVEVLPFEPLPFKSAQPEMRLPSGYSLKTQLLENGSVKFSVENEGGMHVKEYDAIIRPEDYGRLGVPESSEMAVEYGKWSNFKVARDLLQNYYDGHGYTLEGVDISVMKGENGKYKVKISGKSTWDYKHLDAQGDTSKRGDAKAAGGYGEGTRVLAASLLGNSALNTSSVKYSSGEWSVTFDKRYDAVTKTDLMYQTLTKNTEKIEGSTVEFETVDVGLVQSLLEAKDYFYHPNNPDFKNATFENDFFAIKLNPNGENGNFYLIQRFEFADAVSSGVPGATIVFKIKPEHEKLVELNNGKEFDIGAGVDRSSIPKYKLHDILNLYAKTMTNAELAKMIVSMESMWGDSKKSIDCSCIYMPFVEEAHNRKLGIDFSKTKYVYLPSRASGDDIQMMENMGYIVVSEQMAKVGVPSGYTKMESKVLLQPNKKQSQQIQLLNEAVKILQQCTNLETQDLINWADLEQPTYLIKNTGSYSAEAIIEGSKYKGHWLTEMKLNAPFIDVLATILHEISHKCGGDTSVEFSQALVKMKTHITDVLMHNPNALAKFRILEQMYTEIKEGKFDPNSKVSLPSVEGFNADVYKAEISKILEQPFEYKEIADFDALTPWDIEDARKSSKSKIERNKVKRLAVGSWFKSDNFIIRFVDKLFNSGKSTSVESSVEVPVLTENVNKSIVPYGEFVRPKPRVVEKLPSTNDLMKYLDATGEVSLVISDTGNAKPKIQELEPVETKENYNKTVQAKMTVDYAASRKWSKEKVARDCMQNFYDGNGYTLEGTRVNAKKNADGSYTVRIEGKGIYDHAYLTRTGGGTKSTDPKAAGGFGEGSRIIAGYLLANGVESVKFASADWKLEFTNPDRGVENARMCRTLTKNEVPVDGNYVEFNTKDVDFVRCLMDAKDYFYHPNNPDFQNLDIENEFFGFKVHKGENGNLYYVQRFPTEDGKMDGSVKDLTIVFKQQCFGGDFLNAAGLSSTKKFDPTRDRVSISSRNLSTLAENFLKTLTNEQLVQAYMAVDHILKVKDPRQLTSSLIESPSYKFANTIEYELARRIREGKSRLIDMEDAKIVSVGAYESLPDDIKNYFITNGYKFCVQTSDTDWLSIPKATDLYNILQKPHSIKPNEVQVQKMRILQEAIDLFQKYDDYDVFAGKVGDLGVYLYDNSSVQLSGVNYKLFRFGGKGVAFCVKDTQLRDVEFSELLMESLAELVKGSEAPSQGNYSYRLTDLIRSQLKTILEKPEVVKQLQVLEEMYNSINPSPEKPTGKVEFETPTGEVKGMVKADVKSVKPETSTVEVKPENKPESSKPNAKPDVKAKEMSDSDFAAILKECGLNEFGVERLLAAKGVDRVTVASVLKDPKIQKLGLGWEVFRNLNADNLEIFNKLLTYKPIFEKKSTFSKAKPNEWVIYSILPRITKENKVILDQILDNKLLNLSNAAAFNTLLYPINKINAEYVSECLKYFGSDLSQLVYVEGDLHCSHIRHVNETNVNFATDLLKMRESITREQYDAAIRLTSGDFSGMTFKEKSALIEQANSFDAQVKELFAQNGFNLEAIQSALLENRPTIVPAKEKQTKFLKGTMANNNPQAERVLSEFDFAQYGKSGLPLKYSRADFVANVKNILKDLSPAEQGVILSHFGLNVKFDGLMNNKPFDLDEASPSIKAAADKVLAEIENFTLKNEVEIADKEVKEVLDALIQGLPEFTATVGKQQHGTHAYSTDIHMLKVLQSVIKNPEYAKLSDEAKTIVKFSALLHDIGKATGVEDAGHYRTSSDFMASVLDKFNLPEKVKRRIIDTVDDHHWFAAFNKGEISAKQAAAQMRHPEDFAIYKILAKADLENVNDGFHLEKTGCKNAQEFDAYMNGKFAEIEAVRAQMFQTAPVMMNTDFMHNGQKFPTEKVVIDGVEVELKVLNLNEIPDGASLEQYGFPPGTTKENVMFNFHSDSPENLEQTYMLTRPNSKERMEADHPELSYSVINAAADKALGKEGFLLANNNSNLVAASYGNLVSGHQKSLKKSFEGLFDPAGYTAGEKGRNYLRDVFIEKLKKSTGIVLTVEEYGKLYEEHLAGKSYLTQINSDVKIGDKVIKAEDLRFVLQETQQTLITRQSMDSKNNEATQIDPISIGLGGRARKITDCSPEFLRFAAKHPELGIVLFKPKVEAKPEVKPENKPENPTEEVAPFAERLEKSLSVQELTSPELKEVVLENGEFNAEGEFVPDGTYYKTVSGDPLAKKTLYKKYGNKEVQLATTMDGFIEQLKTVQGMQEVSKYYVKSWKSFLERHPEVSIAELSEIIADMDNITQGCNTALVKDFLEHDFRGLRRIEDLKTFKQNIAEYNNFITRLRDNGFDGDVLKSLCDMRLEYFVDEMPKIKPEDFKKNLEFFESLDIDLQKALLRYDKDVILMSHEDVYFERLNVVNDFNKFLADYPEGASLKIGTDARRYSKMEPAKWENQVKLIELAKEIIKSGSKNDYLIKDIVSLGGVKYLELDVKLKETFGGKYDYSLLFKIDPTPEYYLAQTELLKALPKGSCKDWGSLDFFSIGKLYSLADAKGKENLLLKIQLLGKVPQLVCQHDFYDMYGIGFRDVEQFLSQKEIPNLEKVVEFLNHVEPEFLSHITTNRNNKDRYFHLEDDIANSLGLDNMIECAKLHSQLSPDFKEYLRTNAKIVGQFTGRPVNNQNYQYYTSAKELAARIELINKYDGKADPRVLEYVYVGEVKPSENCMDFLAGIDGEFATAILSARSVALIEKMDKPTAEKLMNYINSEKLSENDMRDIAYCFDDVVEVINELTPEELSAISLSSFSVLRYRNIGASVEHIKQNINLTPKRIRDFIKEEAGIAFYDNSYMGYSPDLYLQFIGELESLTPAQLEALGPELTLEYLKKAGYIRSSEDFKINKTNLDNWSVLPKGLKDVLGKDVVNVLFGAKDYDFDFMLTKYNMLENLGLVTPENYYALNTFFRTNSKPLWENFSAMVDAGEINRDNIGPILNSFNKIQNKEHEDYSLVNDLLSTGKLSPADMSDILGSLSYLPEVRAKQKELLNWLLDNNIPDVQAYRRILSYLEDNRMSMMDARIDFAKEVLTEHPELSGNVVADMLRAVDRSPEILEQQKDFARYLLNDGKFDLSSCFDLLRSLQKVGFTEVKDAVELNKVKMQTAKNLIDKNVNDNVVASILRDLNEVSVEVRDFQLEFLDWLIENKVPDYNLGNYIRSLSLERSSRLPVLRRKVDFIKELLSDPKVDKDLSCSFMNVLHSDPVIFAKQKDFIKWMKEKGFKKFVVSDMIVKIVSYDENPELCDVKIAFAKEAFARNVQGFNLSGLLGLTEHKILSPEMLSSKMLEFLDAGVEVDLISDIVSNSATLSIYTSDVIAVLKNMKSEGLAARKFMEFITEGAMPEGLKEKLDLLLVLGKLTEAEKEVLINSGIDVDAKVRGLMLAIKAKHPVISTSKEGINEFLQHIKNNESADAVIQNADFEQYGKEGIRLQYPREEFIQNMDAIIAQNGNLMVGTSSEGVEIPTLKLSDLDQSATASKIQELANLHRSYDIQIDFGNGEIVSAKMFDGTQGGSNNGAFTQVGKNLYYIKYPKLENLGQCVEEVMASQLYRAAGIDSPNMRFVYQNGKIVGVASEYVPMMVDVAGSRQQMVDGFAVDAWLANWDGVKNDNTRYRESGAIKVDVGGSLRYRARGEQKDFTAIVNEISSLIEYNSAYSNITKQELLESLKHVTETSDAVIAEIVKASPLDDLSILQTLLKRKEFLTIFSEKLATLDEANFKSSLDMVNEAKRLTLQDFQIGSGIAERLGYSRTKTGFEGLLNTTGVDGAILKPEEKIQAEKMIAEIEKFTTQNRIADDIPMEPEVREFLNSIIKGAPELAVIFGKPQHSNQSYSLDVHILKVLQESMKDPLYNELGSEDKMALKFATLFHDIGKRYLLEGSDTGHAEKCTEYVASVLDKFNFSDSFKERVCEIVENHHWYKYFCNGGVGEKYVATLCRRPNDFLIYQIMAKADLKGVSEAFYLEKTNASTLLEADANFAANMARIQPFVDELASKQIILGESKFVEVPARVKPSGEVIPAREIPTEKVNLNGEEVDMKVLNLANMPLDADMYQYGFNHIQLKDLRLLAHVVDGKIQLEIFKTLTENPLHHSPQSLSLLSMADLSTYSGGRLGLILEVDNANVSYAYSSNAGSGAHKDMGDFVYEMFENNAHRSLVKDKFVERMKANGEELSDAEYAVVAKYLVKKQYPETSIKTDVKIGDRVIPKDKILDAFIYSRDWLIEEKRMKTHGSHNEIVAMNSRVRGVLAKVNSIQECPQWVLEFAHKNNLPVFILGQSARY